MSIKSKTFFHFRNPDEEISWDAPLVQHTCTFEVGTPPNKRRCRNKVVVGGPYCYVHRLNQQHLVIKPSTDGHGRGLFAVDPSKPANAIIFAHGKDVAKYEGIEITEDQKDALYGPKDSDTGPYALEVGRGTNSRIVDAATDRSAASMVNHRVNARTNARFTETGKIKVKEDKNIRNGQEIFVNYGNAYTFHENDNSTNRNKRKF